MDKSHIVLNAGYAFNRTIWNFIKSKMFEFTHVFNKNWDCALADTMNAYPQIGDLQITALLSRIRNIGFYGIHDDQVENCSLVSRDEGVDTTEFICV